MTTANYKKLKPFIREVNIRNSDLEVDKLLGVSIKKILIPSIANTVGTNMSRYKVIRKGQFAYGPVTSRNGDKISIALLEEYPSAIISQSYKVFEVIDETKLLPEYLMMWFKRPEFDRYARFMSHGSTRETFDWEEMCDTELPIPSIEKQQAVVDEYNTITHRISLNEQLNQKLEETAQAVFDVAFEIDNNCDTETTRLGDLIEIRGGYSYHSSKINQGNSYLLGMGCISFNDRFVESGMRLYSDEFPDKHTVRPLDIIIATRQQSENMPILGYPAMIPEEFMNERLIVASNLYRVINNSYFNNFLLYQLLRSKAYLDNIKLNAKGTTVGMITKDAIEDYYFIKPSVEVIEKTNKRLETLVKAVFRNRKDIKKLNELKDLLLSKMTRVKEKETESI